MGKNMATGRPAMWTRGHGLNGTSSDKDGRQQDRKCSKKMNIFYYDVSRKRVDDHSHGHGHDVAPVGKAEGDLGLNHQTAESLGRNGKADFGPKNSFVSLACEV